MHLLQNLLFELFLLLVTAAVLIKFSGRRLASDVVRDLSDQQRTQDKSESRRQSRSFNFASQAARELSFLRLLPAEQIVLIDRRIKLKILCGMLAGLALCLFAFNAKFLAVLLCPLAGASLAYISAQSSLRRREKKFKNDIIFFLPVVMERIVMAVQAGLDIIPALKVIDQVEQSSKPENLLNVEDPVSALLRRIVKLCESGLSFQAAVNELTSMVDSQALKHALIHLAVAQREGGELLFPLRELSDATQLYFQESVEEDLAKMPIKATLPLLLTFAGLIVTFMAGPLIQIMNVSANPKYVTEAASLQPEDLKQGGR